MSSEFTIRKGPTHWDARVFSNNGEEIAAITKGEGLDFKLISRKDNREWVFTNKVDGQHKRFSFSVSEIEKKEEKKEKKEDRSEKIIMLFLQYKITSSCIMASSTCLQIIQKVNLGTTTLIVLLDTSPD